MKFKNMLIAGTIMLASAFAASTAKAVSVIVFTNTVTFSATAMLQNTTNDNGTTTTIAAPVKHTVTTAVLLQWLAQDEYANSQAYPSNSFPAGAKLVVLTDNFGDFDFQVVDKNGALLVDVNDLFNEDTSGTKIISGSVNDTTHVYVPSGTQLRLFDFSFDDTGITGSAGVRFEMTGIETKKVTDTVPKSGAYTETTTTTVSNCIGTGTYHGDPFIVTGSLSFSGKNTLFLF